MISCRRSCMGSRLILWLAWIPSILPKRNKSKRDSFANIPLSTNRYKNVHRRAVISYMWEWSANGIILTIYITARSATCLLLQTNLSLWRPPWQLLIYWWQINAPSVRYRYRKYQGARIWLAPVATNFAGTVIRITRLWGHNKEFIKFTMSKNAFSFSSARSFFSLFACSASFSLSTATPPSNFA